MSMSEMHEFEGKFIHATAGAILLDIEGEEYWLTLDKCELDEPIINYSTGDDVKIKIPEWLALQKGIL